MVEQAILDHCLEHPRYSASHPASFPMSYGSEFAAKAVRDWLQRLGVRTLYIEPSSLWENGYNKSFNGKLRDKLLNGEIFYGLKEAQVLIERWRRHYNTIRLHNALGYRPPASESVVHHVVDLPSTAQGPRADRRLHHDHSSPN